MAVQASSKTMWADDGAYPVKERLGNSKEDEVLVVDIGGGAGHDLLGFKKRHPEVKGRLVLEELPYVIDQVDKGKLDGVELVEHDFYTPQPIKGASQSRPCHWRPSANTKVRSSCVLPPPDPARLLRRDLSKDLAADQACHGEQDKDPGQRACSP
jgi:hypothetical protein